MMKMGIGRATATGFGGGGDQDWDLQAGGLVVQRRKDQSTGDPTVIRVRVKHGSVYHEISINSQSTFGELKKMLSGRTGLNHQDMKIKYKNKERDSKMFLDLSGVKDRSKMIVEEDPIAQEKRVLEMRKNAAIEKASKAIFDISFDVDRLAGQVSAFETIINKGGRVEEQSLVNLIEMLMNQLLRLDAIAADHEEVKSKKKMQVKRVQKIVEAMDALKIKNSMPREIVHPKIDIKNLENGKLKSVEEEEEQQQKQPLDFFESDHQHLQQRKQQDLLLFEQAEELPKNSSASSEPVVVTTFDSMSSPSASTSAAAATIDKLGPPRFKWEFFD